MIQLAESVSVIAAAAVKFSDAFRLTQSGDVQTRPISCQSLRALPADQRRTLPRRRRCFWRLDIGVPGVPGQSQNPGVVPLWRDLEGRQAALKRPEKSRSDAR